jgi:hypothetical protein
MATSRIGVTFVAPFTLSVLRAPKRRQEDVSTTCDRCDALERWLRDLKLEIKKETERRELGLASRGNEKLSQQLLDEARELFEQIQALYSATDVSTPSEAIPRGRKLARPNQARPKKKATRKAGFMA